MMVRRQLHALGYRFRLHDKRLAGSPDIVLAGLRTVVFVHGCFWHRHDGCRRATTPKTRAEFWKAKFAANQFRDSRVQATLRRTGWAVHVVWECETDDGSWVRPAIQLLNSRRAHPSHGGDRGDGGPEIGRPHARPSRRKIARLGDTIIETSR
jgi:DNA mismatch endonuclease (patch repair protein)